MTGRLMTVEERKILRALADRYFDLRDEIARASGQQFTAVGQFFDDYCRIKKNEFDGIKSGSKSDEKLAKLRKKSARLLADKLAALDSDVSGPPCPSTSQPIKDAFAGTTVKRNAIGAAARELIRLLDRLPDDVESSDPPVPSSLAGFASVAAELESADRPKFPPDILHHSASELADFKMRGFPRTNRDEEDGAPLLMQFAFHHVPVRLDGGEFELRIESTKLHVQLSSPARDIEADRTVLADNGLPLRLKRTKSGLDNKDFRWLLEHPERGAQLNGLFDWISLCYVPKATTAGGRADMTVTAGQIAVCVDGERLGSGATQNSAAARVVQYWAVKAGLGPTNEDDPVYHLGGADIVDIDDD